MATGPRPGWGIAAAEDREALERLLLPLEWSCVTFTAHLRSRDYDSIHVERSSTGVRQAVMLAPPSLLLPVLDPSSPSFPADLLPRLSACLTVMGEERSVRVAEGALGRPPSRAVDYHLMALERLALPPGEESAPGLRVRRAGIADLRSLYPLQRDYEMEEVLLDPTLHNPRLCRSHLRRSLRSEIIYLAEQDNEAVAKAGTNARGVGFDQIGGVFTAIPYRGRGIGRAVMRALLRHVLAEKAGACLFVKRTNTPAITLYRRLGFDMVGSYRISYFMG